MNQSFYFVLFYSSLVAFVLSYIANEGGPWFLSLKEEVCGVIVNGVAETLCTFTTGGGSLHVP